MTRPDSEIRSPDFRVIAETGDFLVVDKPAGLLVHPTKPGGPKTLRDMAAELLGYEIATGGQISLINRLDRETSGIVLIAKQAASARGAAIAMQEGRISKTYHAIVHGWPAADEFIVDAPIIRLGEVASSPVWLMRAVHEQGAPSRTEFHVRTRFRRGDLAYSLVEAKPLTGRTHQIRVHLSHVGHGVVGDKIYGSSGAHYLEFIRTGWTPRLERLLLLDRHALHSSGLSMVWNGSDLAWSCPLPADMAGFLTQAG